MKPTTHTPGPWSATQNHISAHIVTAEGTDIYPTIALVDCCTSNADANAALIAAAPDLLDALNAARGAIAHCAAILGVPQSQTLIPMIDAAIAKAKGR